MFEVSGGVIRGDIEGVTGPASPANKNFNRSHTGTNSPKACLLEVL